MNVQPIASAINVLSEGQAEQAKNAGSLFAQSEVNVSKAFEQFATALTTKPTFEIYEAARVEWVSGYLAIKPNLKADSCNQAFKRFKDRLVQTIQFDVDLGSLKAEKPKSNNPVALKKAQERETKKEQTLATFEHMPTDQVRAELSKAFATLASKPDSKVAESAVKNLKAVLKERTKDDTATLKAEVKELKQTIRGLLAGCSDIERLETVIEVLSPDNDVTIQ